MKGMVSSVYQWRRPAIARTNADPKAVAERDRRAAEPDTRDNTGRLLGDPPPGRSALDKKREAELRKLIGWPELAEEQNEETPHE